MYHVYFRIFVVVAANIDFTSDRERKRERDTHTNVNLACRDCRRPSNRVFLRVGKSYSHLVYIPPTTRIKTASTKLLNVVATSVVVVVGAHEVAIHNI